MAIDYDKIPIPQKEQPPIKIVDKPKTFNQLLEEEYTSAIQKGNGSFFYDRDSDSILIPGEDDEELEDGTSRLRVADTEAEKQHYLNLRKLVWKQNLVQGVIQNLVDASETTSSVGELLSDLGLTISDYAPDPFRKKISDSNGSLVGYYDQEQNTFDWGTESTVNNVTISPEEKIKKESQSLKNIFTKAKKGTNSSLAETFEFFDWFIDEIDTGKLKSVNNTSPEVTRDIIKDYLETKAPQKSCSVINQENKDYPFSRILVLPNSDDLTFINFNTEGKIDPKSRDKIPYSDSYIEELLTRLKDPKNQDSIESLDLEIRETTIENTITRECDQLSLPIPENDLSRTISNLNPIPHDTAIITTEVDKRNHDVRIIHVSLEDKKYKISVGGNRISIENTDSERLAPPADILDQASALNILLDEKGQPFEAMGQQGYYTTHNTSNELIQYQVQKNGKMLMAEGNTQAIFDKNHPKTLAFRKLQKVKARLVQPDKSKDGRDWYEPQEAQVLNNLHTVLESESNNRSRDSLAKVDQIQVQGKNIIGSILVEGKRYNAKIDLSGDEPRIISLTFKKTITRKETETHVVEPEKEKTTGRWMFKKTEIVPAVTEKRTVKKTDTKTVTVDPEDRAFKLSQDALSGEVTKSNLLETYGDQLSEAIDQNQVVGWRGDLWGQVEPVAENDPQESYADKYVAQIGGRTYVFSKLEHHNWTYFDTENKQIYQLKPDQVDNLEAMMSQPYPETDRANLLNLIRAN